MHYLQKMKNKTLEERLMKSMEDMSIVRTTKETLEEAATNYSHDWHKITGLDPDDVSPFTTSIIDFQAGAEWQAERMYSEEDMKQFAFECVGKFLSNDDNKVEIKLVDVIIDRLNKHFEQFKK